MSAVHRQGELRFLKIKERRVNKFNRLLFKKQGNITWFSTFPLISSGQRVLIPRWSVPLSLSQPVPRQSADPQAVSTSVPQAVGTQEDSAAQAVCASFPQTINFQAVNSSFPAVDSTDPQVVSTSVPQTVSSKEDNIAQAVSAASLQTINSQAVSTDPQAVSTSASQADSTNSQDTDATLPQAPPPSRQAISTNTPRGSPGGNSLENPNPKWVINLSSKPLTQAQRSVLAKGPNFVVTPRHPPNPEYITAVETVCTKLGQQDAEELRLKLIEL